MTGTRTGWLVGLGLLAGLLGGAAPGRATPRAEVPEVVLRGVPFSLDLADPELVGEDTLAVSLTGIRSPRTVILRAGEATPVDGVVAEPGAAPTLAWDGGEAAVTFRTLPGWTSILPPLLAILLAIVFRQVVVALLVGVWLGAMLIGGTDPFHGFLRSLDTYVLGSLVDRDHATVLLFSFLLGGTLGIIHRTGGTRGIVALVAPYARTPRSGQLAAWIMGLLVFIDDYANSLLVGNTMRPITDRLRISREKLSYIVDSTAAPVASIAIISTWIGVEVGLIGSAFQAAGIDRDPFSAFVASIPYRFYPIFALIFGLMVALSGRDLGPMLRAEIRARRTGKVLRDGAMPLADFESASLEPPEGKPHRWINAVLPLTVVVFGVLFFIYLLGRRAAIEAGGPLDLKTIVGNADSYSALLWASALGALMAVSLAVTQRILTLNQAVEAWAQGVKSMLPAAVILTLAWSIGMVTGAMHTADFLVHLLGDTLAPHWLPALVFIFAGVTSFATGSSWGTMGILMPLVIPLAHRLAPGHEVTMVGTISSVLAGSVWGDHCSPISDTTVLSSMASSSDHIDHVNTQLPYALLVGVVGILVGDLATAFGFPYWGSWIVGTLILWGVLRTFGRHADAPVSAD